MKPVAIIGGGISGLAAAYYLGREGIPSTLIEAEARLGGVIRTDRANGCLIEAGPDSWLARKPWALGLVRELGLENRVIGSNDDRRKTYVARRGKLIPIPQGMQLLTPAKPMAVLASRLFGIGTKLRMGLEWLRRPAEHPDRSVAEFVRDHFGDEWNERLAQPLLAAVYGGPPERLSVNCVLPALAEYEKRYGSVVRGALKNRPAKAQEPLFLTLKDGLGTLVDALQKAVAPSSRLVRGRVLQIERAGGGWRVRLADGAVETEHVVAAVPAHEAAGFLRRSCGELAQVLDGIPYNSAVTAGLVYRRPGFDRPLDGFGMLIPRSEKLSPAACTWVETKFDHRTSDEATLLRVFFHRRCGGRVDRRRRRRGSGDGARGSEFPDALPRPAGRLPDQPLAAIHGAVHRGARLAAGKNRRAFATPSRSPSGRQRLRRGRHPRLHSPQSSHRGGYRRARRRQSKQGRFFFEDRRLRLMGRGFPDVWGRVSGPPGDGWLGTVRAVDGRAFEAAIQCGESPAWFLPDRFARAANSRHSFAKTFGTGCSSASRTASRSSMPTTPRGKIEAKFAAGGLTLALHPVMQAVGGAWVAHGSGSAGPGDRR